jgi:hypothetical protein
VIWNAALLPLLQEHEEISTARILEALVSGPLRNHPQARGVAHWLLSVYESEKLLRKQALNSSGDHLWVFGLDETPDEAPSIADRKYDSKRQAPGPVRWSPGRIWEDVVMPVLVSEEAQSHGELAEKVAKHPQMQALKEPVKAALPYIWKLIRVGLLIENQGELMLGDEAETATAQDVNKHFGFPSET